MSQVASAVLLCRRWHCLGVAAGGLEHIKRECSACSAVCGRLAQCNDAASAH